MPYISPALSPTRAFGSISSSGSQTSSPAGSTRSSPVTTPGASMAHSADVQFSSSYSNGFPSQASGKPRPTRHHSRSHSSDAFSASLLSPSASSHAKATPDFIFVHPASPAAAEERRTSASYFISSPPQAPHTYATQSLPTHGHHGATATRPSLRSFASSNSAHSARTSSNSSITSNAGDDGDVAPPRSNSSSRRRKFRISASADSSPRASISGQPWELPLPNVEEGSSNGGNAVPTDEGDRSPVYSNRSSRSDDNIVHSNSAQQSSPIARSGSHGSQDQSSPLLRSTDLPANDSALLTSSESNSTASSQYNSSESGEDEFHDGEPFGEVDIDLSEGSTPLATSSRSRPPKAQRPSWGELPTPTMGGTTSFSFGGIVPSARPDSTTSSAAARPQRPKNGKAMSERAESPFRLEIDTNRSRRKTGSEHRPGGLPTPMLRKKSGELVKSSMKHDSRAKSAPTTPTGPKAVHFDQQLERVKLFLAQQRPAAVSRDGSPIETETEDDSEAAFPFPPMTTAIPAQIILVLPDFPRNALPELGDRDVCMETLEIAADSKSLKGTALLRNIAFEKRLSIRFTMDDWQTVSEVTGEWTSTLVGGTVDRWSFNIKLADLLAHIEDKKMYIALRYNVGWQEIWDNNYGKNYLAEFRKQAARSQAVVGGARAARHEWSVTNPGQANERMADLRRELDRLVAQDMSDDFGPADELILNTKDSKNFRFNNPRFLGGEAVPLALAPKESSFSSRYDFGASLKNSATHRNSPQSSHAILDNPYFASPASVAAAAAAQEANSNWRHGGSVPPMPSVISSLAPSSSPNYPITSMSAPVTSVPSSLLSSPQPSINTTAALATHLLDHTRQQSTPEMQNSPLYADDASLISPTATFAPPAAGLTEVIEPSPASFTGNRYFERTEKNGVVITDYAHPNQFSFSSSMVAPFSPASTTSSITSESSGGFDESAATVRGISPPPSPLSDLPTTDSLLGDLTPRPESAFPVGPGGVLVGGAPLSRQLDGAVKSAAIVRGGSNDSSTGSGTPSLEGSNPYSFASARQVKQLDDHELLESVKFSWLTDLGSGASTPTSLEDRRSEDSPIARSMSPSDLLSPSPSSASTDTSVSTPQSPEQSPPLRLYSPYIGGGANGENGSGTLDMATSARPDVGSDTYFNFVHRYCWGSGDPPAATLASSHDGVNDGSSALGLANLQAPLSFDRFASPGSTNSSASSTSTTPRRGTPTPSSLSTSTSFSSAASSNSCSFLLSSTSPHGSRTPSPTMGSPNVETVSRMNGDGYLAGPPAVRI